MATDGIVLRELAVPPPTLRRLLRAHPDRYPVLLDSAAPGRHGRWSILAAAPRYALAKAADGRLERSDGGAVDGHGFLAALEHCWERERRVGLVRPPTIPFAGGWLVFVGYEIAAEIEPRLRLPPTPDAWQALALRVPAAILHDAQTCTSWVVAEPGEEALAAQLAADASAAEQRDPEPCPPPELGTLVEEPPEHFLGRLDRLREAIRAGDIYQANLSRMWRAATVGPLDAPALYERLRRANPAPFAAYLHWRDLTVLSSSPERLLRIEGADISTRPIAGTRPRGGGGDRAEIDALRAHPKERAEHVMLIDLERNDLGRVCEGGSIVVEEFMAVESYAHVHHLVSSVSGRLRCGISPVAALRAVFPGGTITGCPKVRCMQLLAREEGAGRGSYTGSLGYLGHDGSADFNILIRSLTVAADSVVLRAGAGIVADSEPLRELDETRAKARGLLAAIAGAP